VRQIDIKAKFPGWLKAQQLSLAAWRLHNPQAPGPRESFTTYLEAGLVNLSYNRLPVGALALLSALEPHDIDDSSVSADQLRQASEAAMVGLRRERKRPRRPSIVRAARIVSDAIISTGTHSRAIATLGGFNIDHTWRSCSTHRRLRQALDVALPIFQGTREKTYSARQPTTEEKIAALAELSRVATRDKATLSHWHHVEHYTLSAFMVWPLLIIRPPAADESAGVGYALPFILDVHYNYRNKVELLNSPLCKLDKFQKSFVAALEAAKMLWRSEKSHYPLAWRDKVMKASVSIDTQIVSEILEPFGEFDVYGPSLESYFSAAILSRFVGMGNLPPIAATGKLGDRVVLQTISHEDADDLEELDPDEVDAQSSRSTTTLRPDFYVEHVGGIVQKLRWARTTGQCDRVILPQGAADEAAQHIEEQNDRELEDYKRAMEAAGEMVICDQLSRVADTALAGGWRRHRFIRCQDVAWVYSKRQSPEPGHPSIKRVLNFLETNKSPVAAVPEDIALGELILSLRYLNRGWRLAHRPLPPSRALLFFRIVPEEPRGRLLSTLWKAIGAPDDMFRDLINAATLVEARTILARALNQDGPSERHPAFSPPDVLVFITPTRAAQEGTRRAFHFSEEAHLFEDLFSSALDLKSFNPSPWSDVLRSTRVLVIGDSSLDPYFPSPTGALLPADRMALDELATFRHGFTQNMASLVVTDATMRGAGMREWLQKRLSEEHLFMVYGRYFLTRSARLAAQIGDPIRKAQSHGKAALACAPYINPRRLPGLIEFEARLPEMVHEAEYHLAQANRPPKDMDRSYQDAWSRYSRANLLRQYPQARLSCSYEMRTWDVPRYAVSVPDFPLISDAMRIAVDLVKERGTKHLRSWELSTTLGLIDRYLEEIEFTGAKPDLEELSELTDLAKKKLARKAHKALPSLRADDETRVESVMLAARIATIAMRRPAADEKAFLEKVGQQFGKKPSSTWLLRTRDIRKLNRYVWDNLKAEDGLANRAPPQWYARYGDSSYETDEKLALEAYARGRKTWWYFGRATDPLWVHALGLVQSGSAEESQILADLALVSRSRPREFVAFVGRVSRNKSTHALWRAGSEKITLLVELTT